MTVLAADPPVRADGLCVVCLGARRDPSKLTRHRLEAELDPFCSSTCARAWHLNPVPDESVWSLTYGQGDS